MNVLVYPADWAGCVIKLDVGEGEWGLWWIMLGFFGLWAKPVFALV